MKDTESTIQFDGITLKSLTNSLNILYTVSFFCFYYSHISTWTEFPTLKSFSSAYYPVFLALSVFFLLLSGANFRITTFNAPSESTAEKHKVFSFLAIIFFISSLKSMLLLGSHQFFRWEAPHTILTCIFIIHHLSNIRGYLVHLLFLLVIFFRHDLFEVLNPVLLNLTNSEFMISAVADTFLLKTFIVFIFFLIHIRLSKYLRYKKSVKNLFYVIFSIILFFWLNSGRYFRVSEVSVFRSLPYGILIGDSRESQHAFGLLFWLPVVFAGYILSDIMIRLKNKKIISFFFFSVSFFILNFLIYKSATLQTSSKFTSMADLGNEFMIDPANSNMLLFSTLFVTLVFAIQYCLWFQKLKFFKIVSQSVFYQYIFLTLFGAKICSQITALVPNYRFSLSLVLLLFLGICLAYFVNYITSFKFEFTLKPSAGKRKTS